MNILHIVPDSAKNPRFKYLGSTKDVQARAEYFLQRGLTCDQLPVVRTDAQMIAALDGVELSRYQVILLDVPGSFPDVCRAIRRRAPRVRLLFRAHNAEALHRLDWMRAASGVAAKWGYFKLAAEGLYKDLRTARLVDGIVSIAEADSQAYWRRLRPGLPVWDVPYFIPEEFRPPRPAGRAKEDLVVCVTSLQFNPLLEEALGNFILLAQRCRAAGMDWSFAVMGDLGTRSLPAGIGRIGMADTPFEGLETARAVALLSDLGRGFKTKILEAVEAGAWTLVTPGLYDRLPREVRPWCRPMDPAGPLALEELGRCRAPLPPGDPNAALRERSFVEMDAALGLRQREAAAR